MNKQEIKLEYKRNKSAIKLDYKAEKTRLRYAHRMRKEELQYKYKTAPKDLKKEAQKALKREKREYKKEAYLQKSIYLEKKYRLKKKKREALGSVVRIVAEYAPESLVGGLTLNYMLIFLLFALLQGAFVGFATGYTIENRSTDTLQTVAGSLEAGGLNEEIAARLAEENAMQIALYRQDGTLLYTFGRSDLLGKLPYNTRFDQPFAHRYQTEQLRIYSKKVQAGDGVCYLNLAKSMRQENAMLSIVINLILLSIGLVLVISYIVGYRTTRKLLRPIGVLGRAMEEMSAARLSDRLETADIRTELVEVVDSYNRMLDKIEDAYERQKQFVSDASHELRTPLAVIRGYADILSRWGGEEPAVRQEAIEAILAQSTNMQTLLERLLYIARSENGKIQSKPEQTDLQALCKEMVQDFKMMYPQRTFALEGAGVAFCDPALMRQLLTILLDNAVKFTQEDGAITLSLGSADGKTTLTVADNGIGMPAAVAERVFERFYKGDSSHNEKGYGLGLSIAKIIAESQGGTIAVRTEEGKGAAFTVSI